MFLKFISFLGWGILLCLLLTFSFAITLWLGWNTLFALFLWLALIVLIITLAAIGLYLLRHYSDGKIKYILSRYRLTRMECVLLEQWKQGVAVVRRVVRRRHALPWFILTGKQCGKTSLLAGAGLPLVTPRTGHEAIVPTRTLRWSFFKTTAFLDLSSHFLLKSPTYERAWRHLTRWCRRQPPAGIVVCISVNDLLLHDTMQLHLDARQIRAQLEPLTRGLGRHLPLYVFITCGDLIPGFNAWVKQLSAVQKQQALGYHWDTPPMMDSNDPTCINRLFAAWRNGMELARVGMASSLNDHANALLVLDIPEKITELQPALHHYLSALAQPDAYFDSGMLCGVWLTASENQSPNSLSRCSLFMHELLHRHLPALSDYHRRILSSTPYRSRHLWRHALMIFFLLTLGVSGGLSANLLAFQPKILNSDELVVQLQRNETWHQAPWRYFPFIPLLKLQHQWLEIRLLQQFPHATANVAEQLAIYQQKVLTATPVEQNRLIMQLAQTIVAKQQLQQGMVLTRAKLLPVMPTALRLTGVSAVLPVETELALERAQLSHFPNRSPLPAMHQLLRTLVQADNHWQWLYTYEGEPSTVSAAEFGFKSSMTENLPGIWTRAGNDDIHARVTLIEQALGQPITVLNAQLQRLPTLRQEHWLQWIMNLSHNAFVPDDSQSWQALLMDLDRDNSPAMRLADKMNRDLADINTELAQPWLLELRHLQQLHLHTAQTDYLSKITRFDQRLRKHTAQLLHTSDNAVGIPLNLQAATYWQAWRNSVHHATAVALAAPDKSLSLVNGIFLQTKAPTVSPVRQMYSRFEQLRQQSVPPERDDYAINALWTLYQSDANLLLAYAINSAACDMQQRWQQQVLWPLKNNNQQPNPDDQPALALAMVRDFIHDTGPGLLNMTQGTAQAASFHGQALPLTSAYLNLVNHILRPDDILEAPLHNDSQNQDTLVRVEEQQKKLELQKNTLESQSLTINLSSQPATVPGMARLMPTGTRLTLTCDDQSTTLASMNFSEKTRFYWRPGHCQQVRLVINFPQFELHYDYLGDAAWPDFLRDFASGEHAFSADEFDDNKTQLHALKIDDILVRYQLSDPRPQQQAWSAWQQNREQLNELNLQRSDLQEIQEQRHHSRFIGNLALLPTTVAQCYP
ncbi:TPA: type VI secretion protein IcmF/TssM N-terminal domain-containing protein [Yersinia enterocolitica]